MEIDALVYKLRPKGVPGGEAGAGYGLRGVSEARCWGEGD